LFRTLVMADISELRLVANQGGSMSLVHEGRTYKLKHTGKQKKYWSCSKDKENSAGAVWTYLEVTAVIDGKDHVETCRVDEHLAYKMEKKAILKKRSAEETNPIPAVYDEEASAASAVFRPVPDAHAFYHQQQLNELKRLAAGDPRPVSEIYDELANNASTSLDTAAYFPSWDQARNAMYYSRDKRYPRLPARRQDLRLTAEQTNSGCWLRVTAGAGMGRLRLSHPEAAGYDSASGLSSWSLQSVLTLRPLSRSDEDIQATVAGAFGPDDRWRSTVGRRHVVVIGCVQFWFQIGRVVTYGWSDSQIALCWIRNAARNWKPFVRNRVELIHELVRPEDWRYCPTKDNPADAITRGMTLRKLKENRLWWNGPKWLPDEKQWPKERFQQKMREDTLNIIEEERKLTAIVLNTNVENPPIFDSEKFGNFEKMLRVTAYCRRFAFNCKTTSEGRMLRELTSGEIITAEKYWLKIVQREAFHDELQVLQNGRPLTMENRLKPLDPFLDEDGLLRVGGRLRLSDFDYEVKYPIILPKKHHIVNLIIVRAHNNTLHAGSSQTLATLRQNYWILNGRAAVKKVLKNCVICKRQETRPFEQKMADLPKMRTTETFPFERTGLDFLGPLHIIRTDEYTKVYICLFTCMVTRAIHLELLSDLSAERFIQALNRFGSRRGYPKIIQSDNFSTFKMADRQLKNLFSKSSLDKIQRTITSHRIEWKFITERAPWNGGYWERLVRSVKNTLRKILGKTTLDEEELTTVLCEIEAKINARPLTFVGDDVKDADALTPFHFLIGRPFVDIPMTPASTVEEKRLSLNRKWKKRQQIVFHFWKRWRNEYITTFVNRMKWMTKRQEPKEGDIVLVKEDNMKRENWPLGRITTVILGNDGLSRTVQVKTAKGVFTRPVAKLYLLEPNDTE
ncbi:hypothetical protein T10_2980, partial [Trichinella papuae]